MFSTMATGHSYDEKRCEAVYVLALHSIIERLSQGVPSPTTCSLTAFGVLGPPAVPSGLRLPSKYMMSMRANEHRKWNVGGTLVSVCPYPLPQIVLRSSWSLNLTYK